METKVCTGCSEELPATKEYFYQDKTGKYGLAAKCKVCRRKYHENYYQENKEELKERCNNYYFQHHETRKRIKREYHHKNRVEILKKKKAYYENNKEHHALTVKKYRVNNRDKVRKFKVNSEQRRRARKKLLEATFTVEQWNDCLKHFKNECAYCGKQDVKLEQEHFIPVNRGGEYTKNNIVPSCNSCNASKNDKNFFEWYKTRQFYSKQREDKILKYLNYNNQIQQLSIF